MFPKGRENHHRSVDRDLPACIEMLASGWYQPRKNMKLHTLSSWDVFRTNGIEMADFSVRRGPGMQASIVLGPGLYGLTLLTLRGTDVYRWLGG